MTRGGPPLHPYPKAKLKLPPKAVCWFAHNLTHRRRSNSWNFLDCLSQTRQEPVSQSHIKFLITLAESIRTLERVS